MGMLQDHAYYDLDDQTRIEVETRNNILSIEYALIVNGMKQDQITGFIGQFMLRGTVRAAEGDIPVIVHIQQGMFGTKYVLELKGQKIPMNQDR